MAEQTEARQHMVFMGPNSGVTNKHSIQLERGLHVPNSTENHHFDVSLDFAKRAIISTSKQGFRNNCLYVAFC